MRIHLIVANQTLLGETLPAGRSRWLGQDVPSRLRDAVQIPVTVVTEGRRSAVAGGVARD